MKRFSLLCSIALVAAIFSSCSNSSNPTAQMSFDEPKTAAPVSNVTLIQLPESTSPASLKKASTGQGWITPQDGGDVSVTNSYFSLLGPVSTAMTLHFEPGTVKTPMMVSITLDSRTLTFDFAPSGAVFNKPATLSATVSGLLVSLLPSTITFYYINGSSYTPMPGTVVLDRRAGTLTMTDGQVPHFSLYGFGYTK